MIIIIILIVLLILIYSYFIYKKMIELNRITNDLYKTMEIYFNKRIEFLPNIIKIFNQYKIKKDVIDRINFLINDNYKNKIVYEKIKVQEELNNLIDQLYYDVSSNIILKENPIFINVIKQFNDIENEIVISKNLYNKEISKYNKLYKFNRIVGLILNYDYKYLCDIDETKRKKVEFTNKKEIVDLTVEPKDTI